MDGTDAHPLFPLDAVEIWLKSHEKGDGQSAAGELERLWIEYAASGDREATALLVAEAGRRMAGTGRVPPARTHSAAFSDTDLGGVLERTLHAAEQTGTQEVFDFLLGRWISAHLRTVITTPRAVADLMVAVAAAAHPGPVTTVADPACGTGTLLLAAAGRWSPARLVGQDNDPGLTALTTARLALSRPAEAARVATADTLRTGTGTEKADLVLCNPPANQRDWGYAELATDPRWIHGQPPGTEPELAWIQHITSQLAPGGTAVVLVPPAVAKRRAGRRIRSGLIRSGTLRAVIALPPGIAIPYHTGLHLWVLRGAVQPAEHVTMVDTLIAATTTASADGGPRWEAVTGQILAAMSGRETGGSRQVPVLDLLTADSDLTPARHVPQHTPATADLPAAWSAFETARDRLAHAAAPLGALTTAATPGPPPPAATLDELTRAGAVQILTGQPVPEPEHGLPPHDGTPLLTDPPAPGLAPWLTTQTVHQGLNTGTLTLAQPGEVIVATRDFMVRVADTPVALGPGLHALRPDPDLLDPWFTTACLAAPDGARRAASHTTTTPRVDVRRLRVPRMPLAHQQRIGAAYRDLLAARRELAALNTAGETALTAISHLLADGRFTPN
ncbi:N-6 DNA methylase [Streptomyces sp. NPDC059816]|uniref:N-6 DNA methylase n=1 Tax=Streptomyces sp. NPDC059816 TaxID=3346960 RepID=UPI0036618111